MAVLHVVQLWKMIDATSNIMAVYMRRDTISFVSFD